MSFNPVNAVAALVATATVVTAVAAGASIPASSDWVDRGLVVDTGLPGSAWDAIMEGATPCAIVKTGGSYFLYYVGSNDYIPDNDNVGPANRAVGVVLSTDGVRWTKHDGNPVITWSVTGNPEEGVPSCGIRSDPGGLFLAYYGANTALGPAATQVNADSRLAESTDGLGFSDGGIVLDHDHTGVWGSGDELHANMAFEDGGTSYAYYVPNGVPEAHRLGVAWGAAPDSLDRSGPVLTSDGANVGAHGPLSAAMLDPTTVAFFVSDGGDVSVRTTTLGALDRMSDPVETYAGLGNGVVLLDSERRTWFYYYNRWTHIGLRTAPMGSPDKSPPSAPDGVSATAVSHREVRVAWTPASDEETGILEYVVLRDGTEVGRSRGTDFRDNGLTERTTYRYDVHAVNLHDVQGSAGSVSVTTLADTEPPRIAEVRAAATGTSVAVEFDEPVDRASAEDPAHYEIDGPVTISSTTLDADGVTVTLATSPHADNGLFTLRVDGVKDRAAAPNAAAAESRRYTRPDTAGLVAYWRFDEVPAGTVEDTSGLHNVGHLFGGPSSGPGRIGAAVRLDGIDDHAEVAVSRSLERARNGSLTFAAWVNADRIPPDTDQNDRSYAILQGPGQTASLAYGSGGRFTAKVETVDGDFEVRSDVFQPGSWHHVAMTRDDGAGTLSLYVDGIITAGSPIAYSGAAKPPHESANYRNYYEHLRIGARDPEFNWGHEFFDGLVDEVRVYDRALTANEIAALHQAAFCGNGDVDGVEECDDGGSSACDGCSPSCAVEELGDVGESLRVSEGTAAGDVDLSWGPTCSCVLSSLVDYAVYEGTIGDWYDHEPAVCSTSGATSASVTPTRPSAYFLVVPVSTRPSWNEGGAGRDSDGRRRESTGTTCRPLVRGSSCP